MTMHVLQLGPYPPPEGGISRNMLAIRDAVRRRGDTCSIVATSRSSSFDGDPDVYHPGSAAALLALLRSLKFDILHLHIGGDVNKRVLGLAFAATFFGRGKCILTLHSGAYPLTDVAKNASSRSIRGRIFRRFERVIAVNGSIADVFRRYGVDSQRISVIPPFSPKLPDPGVTVPAYIVEFSKNHSPLLLSVGGLEKDYDPLFQIAAMKHILGEYPNGGLLLVGDGSMRPEVEDATAKSGYADAIYIAGNVEHGVVLHLINDADVMLRTTLFDGDAISVREALFLGTPVIATENGMRPDGVHLIEIGDTEALLREINSIAASGKKETSSLTPDTSNIDAVLGLYDELA